MDKELTDAFKQRIFNIRDEKAFNAVALSLFDYQKNHVDPYKKFINALGKNGSGISHYTQIPCIPVTLFRNHIVTDGTPVPELVFTSSGTTARSPSKHYVRDPELYNKSILEGFQRMYGNPADYIFLALLPSYLERSGSSLVYMMQLLINESRNSESGFYLNMTNSLKQILTTHKNSEKKIFLIGVTYALLDLAVDFEFDLSDAIIIETGGMKGTRKELIRAEVHEVLQNAFHTKAIHSEYGMTELLSQAWSKGGGLFSTPPWMRVLIRDVHDPFATAEKGLIHVIDLANIHSCAFLATQDLGRIADGNFIMSGRSDNSEQRGCNLMLG
ncbi:MAG TPA: acyl transferase [Bacteroidia bacterium]|nr:acyl transferase [Bacteroidia bacterium]